MASNVAYHLHGLDSVDYQKEKVEKFVPTLFIGLGGTGTKILLRFRRNLAEQYVNWREDFSRFLVIDTDDTPPSDEFQQVLFRPERGELIRCEISQQDYRSAIQAFRKQYDRRFADWLHPDFESLVPQSAVEKGSGTYRQAGRLAFFIKFPLIQDQILQHMKSALDCAAKRPKTLFGQPGEVFDDRLEVVIVSSLAGGTGSGMVLDTAYLVRHLMDSTPDFRSIRLHTTLIALMPNAFTNAEPTLTRRFQQNAYAAMLEMEHYNTPRPVDAFGRLNPGTNNKLDRPVYRVNWDSPTGKDIEISGRPWDTCYLVDDAHDQQLTLKTTAEDAYQLVADYLFLDFGNNPFAAAKRSARSNHTQLTDRTLATQVLRQPAPAAFSSGNATAPQQPLVVFENYYGCTYSSFGLSEIQIDRDRVIRAAGYYLASKLIQECWLSAPSAVSPTDIKKIVEEDLLGSTLPPGESKALDFSRQALFNEMVTHPEKSLKTAVDDEFRHLRQTDSPGRMKRELQNLLDRLKQAVSPGPNGDGGPDYQLMKGKERKLQGTHVDDSPLFRRLQLLVRERCEQHGILPAQQIIQDLHDAFDKAAKLSRDSSTKAAMTHDDVAHRLEDAAEVPWPCKQMAMKIEFQRAIPMAQSAAWSRYETLAWSLVERTYIHLRDYVGSNKLLEYAALPTLWRQCQLKADFLKQLVELLNHRFQGAVTVQDSKRKQALMPAAGEDGINYAKMITDSLTKGKPFDTSGVSLSQRLPINWAQVEQDILTRIPAEDGRSGAWTRMDLIEAYERDFRRNRDRLPSIIETLARACADRLKESLKLEDLGGGNVVNYLKSPDTLKPDQKMQDFVSSSGVHLPMLGTRGVSNFRPAWRTILGCTASSDPAGQANAATVESEVKAKVETERVTDPASNKVHETRSMLESKLVLVRELAGVPLHVYSRLDSLSKAYFDPAIAQQQMTAHIRWNEGFEELPDIEEVAGTEYDKIQRNIVSVIRGIILEFLSYQPDSGRFMVELTDPRRSAVTRVNLGSRLPRVLQHASTREQVEAFLSQQWQDWYDKVAKGHPEYLALLYCAIQMTLNEFPNELHFRNTADVLPLRSCLEEFLLAVETLLKGSQEGLGLFDQLRLRTEMDGDFRKWREWHPQLCRNLLQGGSIVRLGDHLPFHTVRWRRLVHEGGIEEVKSAFNYSESTRRE